MKRFFYALTAPVALLFVIVANNATVETAPAPAATPAVSVATSGVNASVAMPAGHPVISQAQAAPAAAQAGDYVGSDTCLGCHDDKQNMGPHGRIANVRTPMAGQGCETCHGPGKAHAESGDPALIRNPGNMSPADVNVTCTSCHNAGDQEFWQGSQHDRRSLSCTTCHSVHDPKSPEQQLKAASVTQTCISCHRDKVAKLDRSGHMPVREGKLECTSCHNPHGSQNVRLLRTGNTLNELCTSCHAEKRGPFLFEHAPVRENCATCHDPHGSSNERALVAKLPFLCQRCHSQSRHPSTVYDRTQLLGNNRIYNRGCVNCHSNIHGSNHPSGSTFLR
jgi:DmsE family decaheme c-type cytochrome